MAEQNPPFVIQASSHPADGFRRMVKAIRSQAGVDNTGDMAVTQNGTPNMSVNVAAGQGVIDGTENTTLQGSYEVTNDATKNLAIAASDPTNPRNDLVIAKVQDVAYSGAVNSWSLAVVTGTPAGSPVDPAVPANSLLIARVRVDATVTTILNAKITDLRAFLEGALFPGAAGFTLWDSTGLLKQQATDDNGLWTFRNALQIPYAKDTALPATSYGTVPLKFGESLLGATAASVTFSSIPATFRHLNASAYVKGDTAAVTFSPQFRINNDSTANYDEYQHYDNNATTLAGFEGLGIVALDLGPMPAGTATANFFGAVDVKVKHYAGTTGNKLIHIIGGSGPNNNTLNQHHRSIFGKWRTVATAVNRVDFLAQTGNFIAGSYFSVQLEP